MGTKGKKEQTHCFKPGAEEYEEKKKGKKINEKTEYNTNLDSHSPILYICS